MSTSRIIDRLNAGEHLLMDGGTGSELQRRGVDVLRGVTAETGLHVWSALANKKAPDVVQQVHQEYLRVGADVIINNNFWTSPTRMEPIGLQDEWQDYACAAAEIAIRARDRMNPEAFVAGGKAPPDLQRFGKEPDVDLFGEEEYCTEYSNHAKLLAEVGVDALLPEYVGFIADCVVAVDACVEAGLPVFIGVRHIQNDGSMQYGETLEDLAKAMKGHPLSGILLMCTTPEDVSPGLTRLRDSFDGLYGCYANIGYRPLGPALAEASEDVDRGSDYLITDDYYPARMAEFAKEWKELGAQIIGGCCATGPEHIQAMCPAVKE